MFENRVPSTREVDRLSADVETVCYDWRRMRWVLERLVRTPWWDLPTLCCIYCHAPFEISAGECTHESDCIYERACQIVGMQPLPLPNQAVLDEWKQQAQKPSTFSLRPAAAHEHGAHTTTAEERDDGAKVRPVTAA